MGKYKLFNNVLGWLVCLAASSVYLMTMESTASFWDCGEFISSAYKLEVEHRSSCLPLICLLNLHLIHPK